ncbi:MAG: M56 family metallopeptidase [Planctomycetales bacterium]
MPAFLALDHPLWHRLALALAHSLWQGALIAAVLVAVLHLFAIRRAAHRYAATLVAFLALAVSPLATFFIVNVPAVESAPALSASASPIEFAAALELEDSPAGPRPPSAASLDWRAILAAAQPYLVLLWCCGVSLLGVRLLGGIVSLRRLTADAIAAPEHMARRAARLADRLGLRRLPPLRLSRRARDALAAGFFRPVVLLPISWATAMPADVLEAVLAHELAHIRRHDLWVNLVQRVVEALLFHHPAVWWLSRRLRKERELCCDELAVTLTGQPVGYARALEHVARWRVGSVGPALATGMGGTKMALLDRVRHVLKMNSQDRRAMWPAGLVALGVPLFAFFLPAAFVTAAPEEEGVVVAQADREGEGERREGERREGERREGDRPRPEGERREGDRPRPDGERPPRPDGPPRREGDRERPDRPDGPPRVEGDRERPVRPDGERPPRPEGGPRPEMNAELIEMIRQLRREVEELRREVRTLRGEGPRPPFRPEGGPPRDGERPERPGFRPDGPRGEGDRPGFRPERPDVRPEGRERGDAERREGDRPRPEVRRPDRPDRPDGERREGDRPRPERDRD